MHLILKLSRPGFFAGRKTAWNFAGNKNVPTFALTKLLVKIVYMDKPKNEQHTTEELILLAAEREFLTKGYAGAKTTAIAEAAGVTHAMLHYYFRTKDKLFEKIIADKMASLGEILFGVIGNPGLSLRERIINGVGRHFDFLAANPTLPRFIFNELYSNPHRLETMKSSISSMAARTIDCLQSAIDEEAARGRCRRVEAGMLLLDMVSINIFPFVATPIIDTLAGNLFESREAFLEKRRRENVNTILNKLGIL